jgi:hypothetical protein
MPSMLVETNIKNVYPSVEGMQKGYKEQIILPSPKKNAHKEPQPTKSIARHKAMSISHDYE